METIKGKNCVVVGGAGFLGSHLVDHLIEDRECPTLVVDNLVVGKLDFIHPDAEFCWHDITGSEERLKQIFQKFKADYVFNYAAYPYIPVSFERPLHVFNVNANGAIKVINAAQEAGAKRILQVSSAEIYGNCYNPPDMELGDKEILNHGVKIAEYAPITPHSTYGVAKAAVDYYCQCAWKERQTPVIALRQFNCVGERETHPYIIPEIISQLTKPGFVECLECQKKSGAPTLCDTCLKRRSNGTPILFLGNNSYRDFIYAYDAVTMATELLEKGQPGQVYNLGSESGIRIYDLARKIASLYALGKPFIHLDPKRVRPWEIWHLQSDNKKIYNVISHRPKVDLDKALLKTMTYYKNNKELWGWEKPNV